MLRRHMSLLSSASGCEKNWVVVNFVDIFSRYPTKIKKSLPRRAFAPRSPADLKLGYCIKFTRPGGRLSRGTVKYIGHLPTRNEIFIGVELDGHGKLFYG